MDDDDLILMAGDGAGAGPAPPAVPPFKRALYAYLSLTPAITSLLGSTASGAPAIGPAHPAEGDPFPSLAYRVTSRAPGVCLDGDPGFSEATVEFSARSRDPDQADGIALALQSPAIFHGRAAWSMAGVPIMSSIVESDPEDYSTADDGSDDGTYTETVSINFRYRTR